jgi:hypothetical protein
MTAGYWPAFYGGIKDENLSEGECCGQGSIGRYLCNHHHSPANNSGGGGGGGGWGVSVYPISKQKMANKQSCCERTEENNKNEVVIGSDFFNIGTLGSYLPFRTKPRGVTFNKSENLI